MFGYGHVVLRVFAAVFLMGALIGCAGPSVLVFAPDHEGVGVSEPVFVASTRVFEDGEFGRDRLEGLSFVGFDVSIPPNRELGDVEPVRERGRRIDPASHFFVTSADRYSDSRAFRDALNAELRQRPPLEQEVMVFVHGYNNAFPDGLFRTAQIRYDFDVPGVAVHYSWPSAGRIFGYAYDLDSALFARDGLERLLTDIAADNHNIVIVAHSLGSNVAMEAMRQLSISGRRDVMDQISGVILLSPDIDVDVFRSQAMRIDPMPANFIIFTSQRDRALRISSRITGRPERLGSIGVADDVADFNVTLVDVSEFRGGAGDGFNHLTPASSPATIQILRDAARVNHALEEEASEEYRMLPGMILMVQEATQIVLEPMMGR